MAESYINMLAFISMWNDESHATSVLYSFPDEITLIP